MINKMLHVIQEKHAENTIATWAVGISVVWFTIGALVWIIQ
jgi:hypothetical protein